MNVKRIAAGTIAGVMLASTLCGCSEASRVRRNLNQEADNFNIQRRITVLNARTDKVLLEMEGTFSLSNNSDNELVVTCEVGEGKYQKHYIYLNSYTLYVVEDISGADVDPYHNELNIITEMVGGVKVTTKKSGREHHGNPEDDDRD